MKDPREQLATRVKILESGCWEWQGCIGKGGYGRIYLCRERAILAHRAAYEAAKGPIPPGLDVDHICWNPACCNPEHLRILSKDANRRRQRSAFKTHCKNGHEYTAENTYRGPIGTRDCRACMKERVLRHSARKKAKRNDPQ